MDLYGNNAYFHKVIILSLDSETRHQIEQQVFTEKYASVNGIDQEKNLVRQWKTTNC